jgi:hypothetical protein
MEKKPGQITITVGAVFFGMLFGEGMKFTMEGAGWAGLLGALGVAMAAGVGVLFFWFMLGWRR